MFSVITVTETDNVSGLGLTFQSCDLESIQTGITCLQTKCEEIILRANTCNIVLYSENDHVEKSEKITVEAVNNHIQFQHIDGKAFHLKNVSGVKISNCDISTVDNIDRKLSICEALTCTFVVNLSLDKVS